MEKLFFVFLFTVILGSCNVFFQEEPTADPESIFEFLWQSFDENYAPFEERNVNWDSIYSVYRPMVNDNTSPDELYEILTAMLAT
ncbi:MAG: hypothetical protein ACK4IY_04415, partial [Chitinophagales bacterium]